ncbi:uncharacterized protein LOC123296207 [Chrysoperla carnea]|uniref:uncharacterized protein LOC123296207 n=1 Tax=Chrysoperla carnea TaxID=189513 RepID=UPI001D06D924|nr:uncharacterized protein LOC123296207 [Chrysoperla carnea]
MAQSNADNDTNPNGTKLISLRAQTEQMLHNAVLMTQMAMELKERTTSGEKYVCYLRTLSVRAGRVIAAMQNSGRSFLLLAQKLCLTAIKTIDSLPASEQMMYNIKLEYEKLLNILEKELTDIEDIDGADAVLTQDINNVTLPNIVEKIRYLEIKQKQAECNSLPPTSSTKSVKSDIDEKYPENWSRESLIDLNNVINLPTVPEDIFTSFSKPVRTSSLSSLKNLRKVKLYLKRAANTSDDEEESDNEELEIGSRSVAGDPGLCPNELRTVTVKSGILGNIKEEALQE